MTPSMLPRLALAGMVALLVGAAPLAQTPEPAQDDSIELVRTLANAGDAGLVCALPSADGGSHGVIAWMLRGLYPRWTMTTPGLAGRSPRVSAGPPVTEQLGRRAQKRNSRLNLTIKPRFCSSV